MRKQVAEKNFPSPKTVGKVKDAAKALIHHGGRVHFFLDFKNTHI
jgi:hypothetical protein